MRNLPTQSCQNTTEEAETERNRFTVAGDRIQYLGDVSTPTTDITTAKCLFNSILTTFNAH
jgi:hypothetical protein